MPFINNFCFVGPHKFQRLEYQIWDQSSQTTEVMIQNNLRKSKSLNTDNQKCKKKKQVQTNKRTLIL